MADKTVALQGDVYGDWKYYSNKLVGLSCVFLVFNAP